MTWSKTKLNLFSLLYMVLMLAGALGMQVETDRRMRRDRESIQQQLQADGVSASQAYTLTSGMAHAYDNATSYANTTIFIVIIFTQGMTSLLISALHDDRART
jgi:hypothetical protein